MSSYENIYHNVRQYLELDLFDYSNNKICSLYNSDSDISGQAADVRLTVERNGWKELSFTLPWKCFDGFNSSDNFRIELIHPDYKIRFLDRNGIDWFVVNNYSISHNGHEKLLNVTAGHGSQFLKHKNLQLVFSDNEGNNIGTPSELLDEILKGTGWIKGDVKEFYEKDETTIKRRSLVISEKTGAFKMISSMCDLFDAKPVYRYEERTNSNGIKYWQGVVDIIPLNPFSENLDGSLKDIEKADGIIELYYGKNISGITKSMNSENIVTKLYAYGSYGDTTTGYCSIQECVHSEYTITALYKIEANKLYWIELPDITGNNKKRYFKVPYEIDKDETLVYSTLDPMSLRYLWHVEKEYAIMLYD